jgi:tellurite methyltransferase
MTDWDERYRQGEHTHDEPHPLVLQFVSRLSSGRALDIACGAGRHAIWLAEQGWQVTAVDSSRVAIELLEKRAAQKGITVMSLIADLERHEFSIKSRAYDLILICNYLQRDLFPSIKEGIAPGGLVIAVIAMVDDDPNVKPMNPDYLVNRGELRSYFEAWDLIWYFEGKSGHDHRRATAEIVARRVPAR